MISLCVALVAANLPSITLEDALRGALTNNTELRQVDLDVKRAELALSGAQAERINFALDLNAGNGYGALGLATWTPSGGTTVTPYSGMLPVANAALVARLPIFTGFRLERTIDRASAALVAAQAQRIERRQELTWRVIQAYWQAKRADIHLAIANRLESQAEQAWKASRQNVTLGRVTEATQDRLESTYLDRQADRIKAQDERRIARNQLQMVANLSVLDVELTSHPRLSEAPAGLEQVIKTAQEKRPDLLTASALKLAAQHAVDAAMGERWPQIALEGAYQHGNNPYDPVAQTRQTFTSLTGQAYARVNVSYRMMDNGALERQIQARQCDLEQAIENEQALKSRLVAEVGDALARLQSVRARAALNERSVVLARKNLNFLEGRFHLGYALQAEVAEARAALSTAEYRNVDAAIEVELAHAGLRRAMGILVKW